MGYTTNVLQSCFDDAIKEIQVIVKTGKRGSPEHKEVTERLECISELLIALNSKKEFFYS